MLWRILSVLAYAGLAVWSTWPLAKSAASAIPLGVEPVSTVPLFNTWTIWWNADWLAAGLSGYWDAPIFHPARGTFAFSEPQPTTLIVAPILWLTDSRPLAYNVYLWLSLVLNGVFAGLLLRVLGAQRLVALGGGAAMVLLPIVHWQREVVQLIPLWGILWTWTAFAQIGRQPTVARGAWLGAAVAVTCLTCVHHGLFLVVLLAGSAWTLWSRWLQARTWLALLAAAGVAAVLGGPFLAKLHAVGAKYEFARRPELVKQLSVVPGDYAAAYPKQWISLGAGAARPGWYLSPGWLKVGLALLGVAFGLARRRWRRWTVFLVTTAALAFLLSLGPNLSVRGWEPWWTLAEVMPGMSQVRNVFRFGFFVQMAAVLLAAQALQAGVALSRRFIRPRWGRWPVYAALAAVGAAAVLEVRPAKLDADRDLAEVPERSLHRGWTTFVREHTPAGRAILCLPMATGNHARDFEMTTQWMYLGTFHGVPLVNGYSGFFPPEYFELRDEVNRTFPTEALLLKLSDLGVEFVVVLRDDVAEELLAWAVFESVFLELAFEDPLGIDVYRIRRVP